MMFALEGVEGRVVTGPTEAVEELKRARKTRDLGLVIITDEIEGWAPDLVAQIRFARETPLIVNIPGPTGHTAQATGLADYIREAVGIRI